MRISNYQFKPNWVPTIVTVLLLPVLIALGFWQLSRAEEKQQILEQRSQRLAMSEYQIETIPSDLSQIENRKLLIKGRYLNQYLIYIDNKVYHGQVGYQIVIPFKLSGRDDIIMVNRGWVKATESRDRLPKVSLVDSEQTLRGTAKLDPKDVVSFGSNNRLGTDWPALVLWLDTESLDKDIPGKIASFVFLQDPQPEDKLKREWKFINSPPEKNLSYALQWFSLAGMLLIIYIVVNTKRISKQANYE